MRKFIGVVLAWIGGITLFVVIASFMVLTFARTGKGKIPAKTILELNLEADVIEEEPNDPFAKLTGQSKPVLRDIVESLEKARTDSRVVGLVARMGAAPISLAQAQEIRDAIQSFRSSKKFAIAFSETIGEFGPATGSYYLASAFDEIWLQPSGDVGLTGVTGDSMFLRGTFDKLGIVPRFDHRYEYKNAMNQYTEKKFTPPHREAMEKVFGSMYSQMTRGIAQGRKLSEDQVKALVNEGPFLGKEAVDAKLVDHVAYRDEAYAAVKKKGGDDAELLYLERYLERAGRPHEKGPVVALIYGNGAVTRGKSDYDPFGGSTSMGSDTVTSAFRDAVKDKDVKAILFRVDSPGGSYVASDSIWRETVLAKQAGKPVIVSMSSVAGSGGYFVAMAADKIIAQPGTITGSIGVLGGKMLLNGLYDKIGLSFDGVHFGDNSQMFSTTKDFSQEEWARFQAWLDRVYSDFTSKVADGRKLPKEKVLQIAKGRIWTGEDAKGLGLVDEVGGYPVALKYVKQAMKIQENDSITLRPYPRKKSAFEAVMARLSDKDEGDSSESKQAEMLARVLVKARPLARMVQAAGLDGTSGEVLSMPNFNFKQ